MISVFRLRPLQLVKSRKSMCLYSMPQFLRESCRISGMRLCELRRSNPEQHFVRSSVWIASPAARKDGCFEQVNCIFNNSGIEFIGVIMRQIRIYQPGSYEKNDILELGSDAAMHVGVVLRMQVGEVSW